MYQRQALELGANLAMLAQGLVIAIGIAVFGSLLCRKLENYPTSLAWGVPFQCNRLVVIGKKFAALLLQAAKCERGTAKPLVATTSRTLNSISSG